MDSCTFNIVKPVGVLSTVEVNGEIRNKEVNFISWNGRPPVVDIRTWNADHTEMSRGITMTQPELMEFLRSIKKLTEDEKR